MEAVDSCRARRNAYFIRAGRRVCRATSYPEIFQYGRWRYEKREKVEKAEEFRGQHVGGPVEDPEGSPYLVQHASHGKAQRLRLAVLSRREAGDHRVRQGKRKSRGRSGVQRRGELDSGVAQERGEAEVGSSDAAPRTTDAPARMWCGCRRRTLRVCAPTQQTSLTGTPSRETSERSAKLLTFPDTSPQTYSMKLDH